MLGNRRHFYIELGNTGQASLLVRGEWQRYFAFFRLRSVACAQLVLGFPDDMELVLNEPVSTCKLFLSPLLWR